MDKPLFNEADRKFLTDDPREMDGVAWEVVVHDHDTPWLDADLSIFGGQTLYFSSKLSLAGDSTKAADDLIDKVQSLVDSLHAFMDSVEESKKYV